MRHFYDGDTIIAINNGMDFGVPNGRHCYGIGWIGTVYPGNVIHFTNGMEIKGCDHNNFRIYDVNAAEPSPGSAST